MELSDQCADIFIFKTRDGLWKARMIHENHEQEHIGPYRSIEELFLQLKRTFILRVV